MDGKEKRVSGACAVQPRVRTCMSVHHIVVFGRTPVIKTAPFFLFTQLRSKVVMAEASMAEVPGRRFILDGDIVLLHCPDTSGVVYSKPFG